MEATDLADYTHCPPRAAHREAAIYGISIIIPREGLLFLWNNVFFMEFSEGNWLDVTAMGRRSLSRLSLLRWLCWSEMQHPRDTSHDLPAPELAFHHRSGSFPSESSGSAFLQVWTAAGPDRTSWSIKQVLPVASVGISLVDSLSHITLAQV